MALKKAREGPLSDEDRQPPTSSMKTLLTAAPKLTIAEHQLNITFSHALYLFISYVYAVDMSQKPDEWA